MSTHAEFVEEAYETVHARLNREVDLLNKVRLDVYTLVQNSAFDSFVATFLERPEGVFDLLDSHLRGGDRSFTEQLGEGRTLEYVDHNGVTWLFDTAEPGRGWK